MPEESSKEQRAYELTLHIFSISAGLVGVCLTAIGLIRVVVSQTRVTTVADDILAADAVIFMLCCFLSFWSFKTPHAAYKSRLRAIIDTLFMIALAMMVAVCAIFAYAIM